MMKIFIILCAFLWCFQANSLAQIHEAKVGNVVSIRSSYGYKDPIELKSYEKQKLLQDDKQNKNKLKKPENLFRIYLSKDRFYTKDKYNEKIELAITSHNMSKNYIFDNEYPPYLMIVNKNSEEVLNFVELKYDNPFWITFKLNSEEIEKLQNAEKIKVVLPELEENIFIVNEKKERIEKRPYNSNMKVRELIYELPQDIVKEWQYALNADLTR